MGEGGVKSGSWLLGYGLDSVVWRMENTGVTEMELVL